ncbi:MAG: sulfur carrier protein ThiS [Synechocystis sp.]|nr:sulfur carrier protein ThiS [Synechocystis sp.]
MTFPPHNPIAVWVNGDRRPLSDPVLLPDFLSDQGFNLRLIAVEYNGEILHRQFWPETYLKDGDRLEVVTIVGGGGTTRDKTLPS